MLALLSRRGIAGAHSVLAASTTAPLGVRRASLGAPLAIRTIMHVSAIAVSAHVIVRVSVIAQSSARSPGKGVSARLAESCSNDVGWAKWNCVLCGLLPHLFLMPSIFVLGINLACNMCTGNGNIVCT